MFNKHTRDADRSNPLTPQEILQIEHVFRDKGVSCPFLVNSVCSIYKVRPMVCRVHYEKDSVENCKDNPHLVTPMDGQKILYEATNKFDSELFPIGVKPLAYVVANEFNIDVNSKPFLGVIYDPNNMFNRS